MARTTRLLALLVNAGCAYLDGSRELEEAHREIAEQQAAQERADREKEVAARAEMAAFQAKLAEEQAQRDAPFLRAAECSTPWDARRIDEAARARMSDMPFRENVPAEPSALFILFKGFIEADIPRLEAAQCDIGLRSELEQEWSYLQLREVERQAAYTRAMQEPAAEQIANRSEKKLPIRRAKAATQQATPMTSEELERILVARCGRTVDANGKWIMEGAEQRALCRRDVELELERGR